MRLESKMQVLLIDDEPQVLVALEDLLSEKFVVLKTQSAPRALELIEHEPEIGVVITDQRMPGMNGDEFLARLGSASRACRIMVTGFADITALIRAVNEGKLFAYITKPWNPDNLRQLVERAADHYRLASALEQERQLLSDLMNNAPDAIYFKDQDLRFLRANAAFAAMVGRGDPKELIGKRIEQFLHHPGSSETRAEELAVLEGRAALDVVRSYPGRTARWFSETKAPVRGPRGEVLGLVGIAREVTERVATERALRDSELRQREQAGILRAILDGMPDGVVVAAPDGSFLVFNAQAEKILGSGPRKLSLEEWARAYGLFLPDQRHPLALEHDPLVQAMKQGTSSTAEVEVRNDSAPGARIAISATPLIDQSGTLLGSIALLRDVTEQRQRELEQAQSQKMEAIGRLAGGIAHDFNNLLTIIESYGALMLGDMSEGDPKRQDLAEMLSAARRATTLTRQLLTFSRRGTIEPQVLDLNAIIREVQRMLGRILGDDVELFLLLSPEISAIRADAGQIEQILMNLTINARDAMPAGGRLTIETVAAAEEGAGQEQMAAGLVILSVRDSGTGMSAETQKRIFEPFFSTKDSGKGTGLGLATVYGIVQRSGARIRVDSELGRGTNFSIYFPGVRRVREAG